LLRRATNINTQSDTMNLIGMIDPNIDIITTTIKSKARRHPQMAAAVRDSPFRAN